MERKVDSTGVLSGLPDRSTSKCRMFLHYYKTHPYVEFCTETMFRKYISKYYTDKIQGVAYSPLLEPIALIEVREEYFQRDGKRFDMTFREICVIIGGMWDGSVK